MAKRFLTHLDLAGNQILNAAFEKLTADPTTGNFEGRIYFNTTTDVLRVYHTSAWHSVGAITEIQGTANEVEVSVVDGVATIGLPSSITVNVTGDLTGNADTATKLATARTIGLGGDLSGSASFDGSANVSITATIAENSVALGTDTTGNYVASVSGTDGVSVSGSGEGAAVTVANTDKGSSQNIFKNISDGTTSVVADSNDDTVTFSGGTGISVTANATTDTLTIANTGVTSVSGTANEVTVSGSTGSVTIGLPDSVTITSDLTVGGNTVLNGNLTVNGTTTTIDTQNLNVEDSIITLNYGQTGTPALDGGIEIERGDSSNVTLKWNETSDVWQATTDGTTYKKILLSGDATASDVSDFTEAAQDAVGAMLVDTSTIDLTYTDGTPELKADIKTATTSYLVTASGLGVDISAVKTKLVADSFTKKATANVGNGTNTSFAVTHNFNTRDVVVNVYDNATYDTVEVDVVRTGVNTVTVSFASAPASNAYRVVVIG